MNLSSAFLETVTLEELITEIMRRGFSITFNPMYTNAMKEELASLKNKNNLLSQEDLSEWVRGETLGGKKKQFLWRLNLKENQLEVNRVDANIQDIFSFQEIVKILNTLKSKFGDTDIPLANNVEKLKNNEEQDGFGKTIYDLSAGTQIKRITKAQGASQLAPILCDCEILFWDGKKKNMCFSLKNIPDDEQHLIEIFMKKSVN